MFWNALFTRKNLQRRTTVPHHLIHKICCMILCSYLQGFHEHQCNLHGSLHRQLKEHWIFHRLIQRKTYPAFTHQMGHIFWRIWTWNWRQVACSRPDTWRSDYRTGRCQEAKQPPIHAQRKLNAPVTRTQACILLSGSIDPASDPPATPVTSAGTGRIRRLNLIDSTLHLQKAWREAWRGGFKGDFKGASRGLQGERGLKGAWRGAEGGLKGLQGEGGLKGKGLEGGLKGKGLEGGLKGAWRG